MLRSRTDRRAQIAFEFVFLVGLLLTAFTIFSFFVVDTFEDVRSDTDYFKMKDVALSIKAEMSLAATLEDGYQRYFFVPLTIDGLEYNITKTDSYITFSSGGADYLVVVPPFTGNIVKGNNVIMKDSGILEVNP